ncbi:hypothetical protein GQ53DRAFT_42667 [Thozetella sp. PMI_491]|nr:hypothetical protein GQ53DRAFT_42667 [Thozetella sp. PMI_491]
MTAVAAPPSFSNLNRAAWINGGQPLNPMNPDEGRGNMFVPRRPLQRNNSSSSISSVSSTSSNATVTSNPPQNGNPPAGAGEVNGWTNGAPRNKKPQPTRQWPVGKPEPVGEYMGRGQQLRPAMSNGVNGASTMQLLPSQGGQMMSQNGMSRPGTEGMGSARQPVLYLLSMNGTFERKTISVPFYPDTLRIGRQTNAKTVPTPVNGFFDSKVLSRQHAEIWADTNGKIWIRDVKSSNGTFVNGIRLSQENRESEPHELQTHDHLELGIDIVHEDQKTVVHHKVSARVEHAGFISPSNSLLDMNFGDLDPSNGGIMIPMGGVPPLRGRTGSQSSMASNGRGPPNMMVPQANGMAQPRQFWLSPMTTEQIVKRLHNEIRYARLQNQDLQRTGQFINALLSKDDIKNQEKPDGPEPAKGHINGNAATSFQSNSGRARFSDPPAPPPSQPLPEKPDVPSLKRGTTERPSSVPPSNTSPVRQENNLSQIIQLTEALNNAKKEIDSHSARVRDLEEMLHKERQARMFAEDMVQKMEEHSTHAKLNGAVVPPTAGQGSELEKAFDPPAERPLTPEPTDVPASEEADETLSPEKVDASAAVFQARIETMILEMRSLREQLAAVKQRADQAEAERDADRQSLAAMVLQIQQRDEEDKKREAERKSRPRSTARSRHRSPATAAEGSKPMANGSTPEELPRMDRTVDDASEEPTLSRANTITPSMEARTKPQQDQALIRTLPYASMMGVVLLGMGLMAYLNGWQQPKLDR